MVAAEIRKKISNVDEKDVVQLAVELGNITAPSGYEQPVADYVENWFRAQGFRAFQQNLCEKRSNAIGIFKGAGGGSTLVFNSHMDSDQGRPRFHGEPIPLGPKVRIEGRRIFGKTVQNDRGPMAAFMIGVNAIKNAGIRLKGDVLMSAVLGEIGMAPIDEFQARREK